MIDFRDYCTNEDCGQRPEAGEDPILWFEREPRR